MQRSRAARRAAGSYTSAARSDYAFWSWELPGAARSRAEQICCAELRASGPITGIETVEHAQIRRPVGRAAATVVLFVLQQGLLAGFWRDFDQLAAGCFHRQLNFGGFQQMLHQNESLARGLADREHPVIVHDHGAIAAEMGNQPFTLGEILGDALIGMVTDAAEEAHRLLREHPQSALESRNRHSGPGMQVHGAVDVA